MVTWQFLTVATEAGTNANSTTIPANKLVLYTIDLEYFWLVNLFSSSSVIVAAYTSWYEVIIELTMASGRDPAEIENELASIGAGF